MKRLPLCLAVASLGLASSSLYAQGNVEIYGTIDIGFSRLGNSNAHNTGSKTSIDSGMSASNALGFKGTEDLGKGLSAFFVLENHFEADTGNEADRLWASSYVGLQGDFGLVQAGRFDTAHYTFLSALDPFEDGMVGKYSNVYSDLPGGGAYGVLDKDTVSNAVLYATPTYAGFTGMIGYISQVDGQENTANDGDVRVIPVFLQYENGPVYAGIHYSRAWVDSYRPEETRNCLSNIDRAKCDKAKITNWAVGGSYDFEVVKLSAFYDHNTWKNALNSGEDLKLKTWMIGASIPLGRHTILASYNRSTLDGVHEFGETEISRDGTAKQWALGYTYDLSKRTKFYAAYADISNDRNRYAAIGDATQDPSDEAQAGSGYQSGFSLGIRHDF